MSPFLDRRELLRGFIVTAGAAALTPAPQASAAPLGALMMTPTGKAFTKIDGTPVYYTAGGLTARTWYCADSFYDRLVPWVRSLRYYSRTYGGGNYDSLAYLKAQGFYTDKAGSHGLGRAMDLAQIKWSAAASSPLHGDHRSTTVATRRRYFAVDALCRRRFRYVLDGNYNAAHTNHLHCDDSALPTVMVKTSRADTVFVQAALNSLLGTSLAVDGVWGRGTASALASAMTKLKVVGDPHTTPAAWHSFCNRLAAHGFRNKELGFYDWYRLDNFYSWQSENRPGSFIRHRGGLGHLSAASTASDRLDATWRIREGLTGYGISLESRNFPGQYLRHANGRLRLSVNAGDNLFKRDATFYPRNGLFRDGGRWRSLEASNFPGHYIRHRNGELWLDKFDGTDLFRHDATWSFGTPLAA